MLWFFYRTDNGSVVVSSFQYIQCYGSSNGNARVDEIDEAFQYIQCYGSSYFQQLQV